jgi:hypothetical protein
MSLPLNQQPMFPVNSVVRPFNNIGAGPLDAKTVTSTTSFRNALPGQFPGMVVTVLGPPDTNNAALFPNITHWRLTRDTNGGSSVDSDWAPLSALNAGTFMGQVDPTVPYNMTAGAGYNPDLNNAGLRNSLTIGAYYLIKADGTFNPTVDTIGAVTAAGSMLWNGTRFFYQPANYKVIVPLYEKNATDLALFQSDVKTLIRQNAIIQYSAKSYQPGEVVYNTQTVGANTFTEIFYCTLAMSAAESVLYPATSRKAGAWTLIGSTAGGVNIDDTLGTPATAKPANPSSKYTLSPQEIDARIREFGGSNTGAIQGGNAATFASEVITEAPLNTP